MIVYLSMEIHIMKRMGRINVQFISDLLFTKNPLSNDRQGILFIFLFQRVWVVILLLPDFVFYHHRFLPG